MQIIIDMHEREVQYILEKTTAAKLTMEDYIKKLVREDWKRETYGKKEEER